MADSFDHNALLQPRGKVAKPRPIKQVSYLLNGHTGPCVASQVTRSWGNTFFLDPYTTTSCNNQLLPGTYNIPAMSMQPKRHIFTSAKFSLGNHISCFTSVKCSRYTTKVRLLAPLWASKIHPLCMLHHCTCKESPWQRTKHLALYIIYSTGWSLRFLTVTVYVDSLLSLPVTR